MKSCIYCLLAACLLFSTAWSAESQPAFELKDPRAEILKFSVGGDESSQAVVVLPGDYRAAGSQPAVTLTVDEGLERRYSVIYLLHGAGGDHTDWYRHMVEAGISPSKLADEFGAILVMPDGKKTSWYLDVPKDATDAAKWQWETVITKHLIPEVDRKYRTWAVPASRGIAGLSMGGHGALYLAARHPDLFGACVSLSGAVDLSRLAGKYDLADRLGAIEQHRDRYVEHSAMTQVEKFAGKNVKILIDCGTEDPFIEENRELSKKLKKLNIEHEYGERSGGHEWKYWIEGVPHYMKFLAGYLKPAGWAPVESTEAFFKYKTIIVDQNLPDDPYGVNVTDMNKDNLLDIVVIRFYGVDWYEGPDWKKHVVLTNQTKMNSYGTSLDVDRDGRMDLMISADFDVNNTKKGGSLWFARGPAKEDGEWKLTKIADNMPTLHRIRWCDTTGDGIFELYAQPLKGRGTTAPYFDDKGAELMMFTIPPNPEKDPWPMEVVDDTLHVSHALEPVQFDNNAGAELLATSFEGVHMFMRLRNGSWKKYRICEGEQATDPNRGASEVVQAKMAGGQKRYIATIEPWHGNEVVVYHEPPDWKDLWSRTVIDDTLDQGHAIDSGDLDGDGFDEIIAGYRGPNKEHGKPTSLKAYRMVDFTTNSWKVQWIDFGGMAAEDIWVRDLNGDGMDDIVAVGRATRNVKIYMNTGTR